MNNRLHCAVLLFGGALSFGSWGCSSQPDRPATAPVRGVVTYQGKPVSKAAVAFLAPGAPAPAAAVTDASGQFQLSTFQPGDGAVLGMHVVTVRQLPKTVDLPTGGSTQATSAGPVDIEQAMRKTAHAITIARESPPAIPRKYETRKTSDLRFEVKDGDNLFDLKLVD
jgi:hypothetical protein